MSDPRGQRLTLRSSDLSWRTVGDEIIVLDLAKSVYYSVDGAGVTLWPALVDGASKEQLADLLVSTFGIDAATAATDAEAFVADLGARGLLDV